MHNGEHTPRKFLVYFDDPEQGIVVFEDEKEAREFWKQASITWNCYLFGALPINP